MAWTDSVAKLPDKQRKKAPAQSTSVKKKAPELIEEADSDAAIGEPAVAQPSLADRKRGIAAAQAKAQKKTRAAAADTRSTRSNGRSAGRNAQETSEMPEPIAVAPEPLSTNRRPRRSPRTDPAPAPAATRVEAVVERFNPPLVAPPSQAEEPVAPGDVRFAADGHHPAETTTGLLSKLRRQPKLPDSHIHKYRESGSSVGLVRRVCIECSHVSIGRDD
jgi:hypothetical protein